MRDADGLQVLHRRDQGAIRHGVVALESDPADFHCRAFLDVEGQGDPGGRDGLDFGGDARELVAVLAEQLFQDDFGTLDLGGVVLAFNRDGNLRLLEALEHIGLGDRVEALVFDGLDGGLFADVDDQLDALGCVRALDPHIFEVAGVPKRVEVALDNRGIVQITLVREQARQHAFLGDTAVPDDLRLAQGLSSRGASRAEDVLLCGDGGGRLCHGGCSLRQEQRQQRHRGNDAAMTEASAHKILAASQGAQALSFHGKNNYTLTALVIPP